MSNSTPLLKKLVALGVSQPYASQISRGVRTPSLRLAIRIYRELGVKLGPIAGASSAEIRTLEKVGARSIAAKDPASNPTPEEPNATPGEKIFFDGTPPRGEAA